MIGRIGVRPGPDYTSGAPRLSDPMSNPAPGTPDHDAHRLLGLHAHAWVLANINLADNKAAFAAFGAAALGAYLRPEVGAWVGAPVWEAAPLIRVAALLCLLAGSVCALVAVAPRSRGTGRSLTFWGGIAQHADLDEYVRAVQERDSEELNRALLEQVYIISRLAARKFRWLRCSIWLVAGGFLLALIAPLVP